MTKVQRLKKAMFVASASSSEEEGRQTSRKNDRNGTSSGEGVNTLSVSHERHRRIFYQVEKSSVAVVSPACLHESNLALRPTPSGLLVSSSSGLLVSSERASEERPRADKQGK